MSSRFCRKFIRNKYKNYYERKKSNDSSWVHLEIDHERQSIKFIDDVIIFIFSRQKLIDLVKNSPKKRKEYFLKVF